MKRTLTVSARFASALPAFAREVWPHVETYEPVTSTSARVVGDEARIREAAERHGLDVRAA